MACPCHLLDRDRYGRCYAHSKWACLGSVADITLLKRCGAQILEHAKARSNPDLEGVKRNMEQILSSQESGFEQILKASDGLAEVALNNDTTAPGVVRQLAVACDTIASNIQRAGEEIVQIANGIAAATAAVAELVRRHGADISYRIENFTVMTRRVSNVSRDVRADLPLAPGE